MIDLTFNKQDNTRATVPAIHAENGTYETDLLEVALCGKFCDCLVKRPIKTTKGLCAHILRHAQKIGKDISFFMHRKDSSVAWLEQAKALEISKEAKHEFPKTTRDFLTFERCKKHLHLKDTSIALTPALAERAGAKKGRRNEFKRVKIGGMEGKGKKK